MSVVFLLQVREPRPGEVESCYGQGITAEPRPHLDPALNFVSGGATMAGINAFIKPQSPLLMSGSASSSLKATSLSTDWEHKDREGSLGPED